ncbi:hypothetical protein JI721_09420 [Alicyclobacillus cycloheptanicus]|uniref:Membrane protein n=1 Tax=Alicyclobacillus cycloheptanicus TaxID=1457 RepID=A0ABT9XMR3_9BACL|nr:hypothetical protein [Alicyclobacillus cycloheptanicus]MDQ0191507.1 putative membrane protein [Alicyclobacillus cycloheptanicus]WDL99989.1 hypothetical protein JI721_09420 [Alicyclobacillus cycloheptanicus]
MIISRRTIQTVLGIIWFIDGLLQLKPQMFTKSFIEQVILPVAQGQPAWIGHSVTWAAHVIEPHIGVYNVIFAVIQLLIGLGLMFNVKVKTTLTISFIWTLIVWWFGEGFGQLLTGQALLLMGAPGAVLLYGLIGWSIWPDKDTDTQSGISRRGIKIARWSLGILWILGAILQLQPTYLTPKGIGGMFTADWMASLVGNNGVSVSIILAVIELAIGLGILINRRVGPFMWASIILSLFFWWVGQSFGQMFTALGTDPNAGPLFVLLTLTAFPTLFARVELDDKPQAKNGPATI